MSNIDKNKVFFGLLHYIFTEQPNVNWAFKTSLVNFTGINETLNQRRYKNDSISNDIIKYIKYVKPYHVQFDHYIEKYKVPLEICNTKVNDSIFPTIKIRYDNVSPKPDIYDYLYSSEKYKVNTTYIDDDYKYGKFKDFKISVVNQSFDNEDNNHFFFPSEWGKLVDVKQTVSNNEQHDSYIYTLSLRFSNNYVLPVVIRRNDAGYCNIEWNLNLVERTNIRTYNSACYKTDSRTWINTYAQDEPNHMKWSRNNIEVANQNQNEAKACHWDEDHLINNKASVNTSRFNISFSNGRLVIYDTYRTNMFLGSYSYYDETPTHFFPEAWGKLVNVNQTVANNKTHKGYVYTLSLRFENNYVLPVLIERDDTGYCRVIWNFNWVERTNVTSYNGGTYQSATDSWINTTAQNEPDHMIWASNGIERANINYREAKSYHWDEDHLINNKPSVNTSRFNVSYSFNRILIYDTYRNFLIFEGYDFYKTEKKSNWFYGCVIDFDKDYSLPLIINHKNGILIEDPGNTFFPREWGKLIDAYQSVSNDEEHKGYVYTLSLRFENNYVLPVVVRRSSSGYCNIEWNFDFVEETDITTYNSATYQLNDNSWINTTAQDEPYHMIWSRLGIECANKNYTEAKSCHWDEDHLINHRTSSQTSRFNIIFNNGVLTIYDRYRNDNLLGSFTYYDENATDDGVQSYFPEEWGCLNGVRQGMTNNTTHTSYEYGIVLRFTNNFVLPILVKKDDINNPVINFNLVEETDITTYNSIVYEKISNTWLNAYADDKPNQMKWSRYSKEKANADYIIAKEKNWDEGHLVDEHPSTKTNRFKFDVVNNYLQIYDTYNNNHLISKLKLPGKPYRYHWDDSEVYSKNPDNEIIYDLNTIENTTVNYNGSIITDNRDIILVNSFDDINSMKWIRENQIINEITYDDANTLSHPKWDYGNNLYTSTETYYGKISDDKLTLTIYNYDDTIFKEYDLETFSEKIVEKHTETSIEEPLNKLILSEGTKYYNEDDLVIYRLTTDRKGNLIWVYDSIPVENELYYFKKTDSIKIYKTIYNNELKKYVTDFYDLDNNDYIRLNETTMANRLFLYKTHDLELIKEYTNSHFKGITIDGGDLNIDRQGYDAFLYDLKRYEEPTKTNAYCIIDENYTQILTGSLGFTINYPRELGKNEIIITSSLKTDEIKDYSIDNNRITLFTEILKDEVITVKFINGSIIQRFIANSFDESEDENYNKKFIKKNERKTNGDFELSIPYSSIKVNKVVVSIEKPNGYRKPTQNYDIINDKIYIHDFNNMNPSDMINWKIYISIADYSLIYDKIYTWEDVYGVANNNTLWEQYYKNHGLIQNINGNDFLNPHYEKNRPDELCVSQPQDSMMMYFYRPNSKKSKKIFNYNFKNDQKMIPIVKTSILTKNFNIGDTEIWIEKDVFDKPYKDPDDNKKLKPGKIIIDSEIIEFYDYELFDNKSIVLRKIRRGIDGTFIKKTHLSNTVVYPFGAYNEHPYYLTPSYYYVKDKNMIEFDINGNKSIHENRIEVYKTNRISLLTEINEYQDSFIISDNSIILPQYDENNNLIKKGYLFINDIKITFNNIEEITYKNNICYKISNYDLPIGVSFNSTDELIIPSNKYIKIKEEDYTINTTQHKKLENTKEQRFRNYITFNIPVNIGENVIIENYNFNVFN